MTVILAETALLPGGWAGSVRVTLGRDGRIASVVPGADPVEGEERVAVLLPAPSNLHSHAFQRAMAGLTEHREGAEDSFWSWRDLMYRFLRRLTPEHVEAIAAQVQMEMLESGYAAVAEFHYLHHGIDGTPYDAPAEMARRVAGAADETGIGLTLLPVLYMQGDADGAPLAGGQLRFGCDFARFAEVMIDAGAGLAGLDGDAILGVAPHSLRAVPPELLSETAALTPGPVHIHAAEQAAEVAEIEAVLGARPVAYLLGEAGADARWCLIHATQMTSAETLALAGSGAVAGLCPLTEANLGDGVFDGARYLAAGGRFGVGSDSNLRIGLTEELRQLEHSQRLRDHARGVLCTAEASVGRTLFEGACRGGAQALGRKSGAIEAGHWADLVALDGDALCLAGTTGDRLLDAWIFAGDDRAVDAVWSAGRRVVSDGRHRARDRIEARYRRALATLADAV